MEPGGRPAPGGGRDPVLDREPDEGGPVRAGQPAPDLGAGDRARRPGALGSPENALLVKTSGLRQVRIDPECRRAHVQAGAQWQDVTVPAAEHGLAALAGSSPNRPGQGPAAPRDAAFAIYGVGTAADATSAAATHADLDRLLDAVRPWDRGRSFPTLSERAGTTLFPPAVHDRLRDVKRRYDPGNVLAGGHPIPPAE